MKGMLLCLFSDVDKFFWLKSVFIRHTFDIFALLTKLILHAWKFRPYTLEITL